MVFYTNCLLFVFFLVGVLDEASMLSFSAWGLVLPWNTGSCCALQHLVCGIHFLSPNTHSSGLGQEMASGSNIQQGKFLVTATWGRLTAGAALPCSLTGLCLSELFTFLFVRGQNRLFGKEPPADWQLTGRTAVLALWFSSWYCYSEAGNESANRDKSVCLQYLQHGRSTP